MTEQEEDLIYDTMVMISENSREIVELLKGHGNQNQVRAYKSGMYAPCIRLQTMLPTEAMRRGYARNYKLLREIQEYFHTEPPDGIPHPEILRLNQVVEELTKELDALKNPENTRYKSVAVLAAENPNLMEYLKQLEGQVKLQPPTPDA